MRLIGAGFIVCLAAVALALIFWPGPKAPAPDKPAADPTPEVPRFTVEGRKAILDKEQQAYAPKSAPLITDLDTDAAALLRGLPGVSEVQVKPPAEGKPTARLIHFLDWHYVPRDLLALDFAGAMGRPMTDKDYEQHLVDVELVELDQVAALGALARYHGLKTVLAERLTETDMPNLPDRLAALREVQKHRGELGRQLAEVKDMLGRAAPGSGRQAELQAVEKEIVGMQAAHRREMLEMGAAFTLHLDGRLDLVLPLDNAALLDNANPVKADGRIQYDNEAKAKRQDAMVRNALAAGPVAIIVCGGANDLSAAMRRVASKQCEYVRVAGPAYRAIAGEK